MGDEAVKKRLYRAKQDAMRLLGQTGWDILPSDNSRICFIATRSSEIRMVRVCIDSITDHDRQAARSFRSPAPHVCTREIWCQKNGRGFIIEEA